MVILGHARFVLRNGLQDLGCINPNPGKQRAVSQSCRRAIIGASDPSCLIVDAGRSWPLGVAPNRSTAGCRWGQLASTLGRTSPVLGPHPHQASLSLGGGGAHFVRLRRNSRLTRSKSGWHWRQLSRCSPMLGNLNQIWLIVKPHWAPSLAPDNCVGSRSDLA